MIAYLTDGNEILLSQCVTCEELSRLNAQAQESTDGELWWETAVSTPSLTLSHMLNNTRQHLTPTERNYQQLIDQFLKEKNQQ